MRSYVSLKSAGKIVKIDVFQNGRRRTLEIENTHIF